VLARVAPAIRFAVTIATSVTGAADLKTIPTRERPEAYLCDGYHIALMATFIPSNQREPCRAVPRLGMRHHPQRTLQWPPSKRK
jgi:hypothetical protein